MRLFWWIFRVRPVFFFAILPARILPSKKVCEDYISFISHLRLNLYVKPAKFSSISPKSTTALVRSAHEMRVIMRAQEGCRRCKYICEAAGLESLIYPLSCSFPYGEVDPTTSVCQQRLKKLGFSLGEIAVLAAIYLAHYYPSSTRLEKRSTPDVIVPGDFW